VVPETVRKKNCAGVPERRIIPVRKKFRGKKKEQKLGSRDAGELRVTRGAKKGGSTPRSICTRGVSEPGASNLRPKKPGARRL